MITNKVKLLTLFLFLNCLLFGQSTPAIHGIVAGTNRQYVITFNSGQVISGKILSIDKETLIVSSKNSKQSYYLSEIRKIEENKRQYIGSIGIGLGVQYGTLGLSGEVFLIPNISLNVGFGTAIFVSPIVNAGAKFYLRAPKYTWRPRAAIYYGTNGIIYHEGNGYSLPEISERVNGVSLSIGQVWTFGMNKNHGFDLDLVYLINDLESRLTEYNNMGYDFDFNATGKVKISLGYRYLF